MKIEKLDEITKKRDVLDPVVMLRIIRKINEIIDHVNKSAKER